MKWENIFAYSFISYLSWKFNSNKCIISDLNTSDLNINYLDAIYETRKKYFVPRRHRYFSYR